MPLTIDNFILNYPHEERADSQHFLRQVLTELAERIPAECDIHVNRFTLSASSENTPADVAEACSRRLLRVKGGN